ncbi:MAG: hypothetical protein U5K31_14655 [Balneolaceae bacterium]|nr:hypothetical protein [Balneolaceae bacterium]
MEFIFQGFQTGLPPWLFLLLAAVSVGLAWWSYRHLASLPFSARLGMASLRAAVLLLLLVLLLNPFFRAREELPRDPEILVFLDASASAGITKGDYRGMESYRETAAELGLEGREGVRFSYVAFDRQVQSLASLDSLRTEGGETNLYNLFEVLEDRRSEATAALLLSDGIFTQGRSPAFEAASSPLPLFTVALGDTSRQRDITVQNVVTNTTGYLDTPQPVEVTVGAHGYEGRPLQVELRRGEELVESRQVTPSSSRESLSLRFELQPEATGLQQYQVRVPALEDEWTAENNTRPFAVDVLDDRQRILSVAFEIHPDVRMMRGLLQGEENTRLSRRTWLGSSRFLEGPFRFDPDTLDLLVMHGYPAGGLPSETAGQLQEIMTSVPALYLHAPSASLVRMQKQLGTSLPVRAAGESPAREVSPVPAVETDDHPVMELPAATYASLPSLQAPVENLEAGAASITLFESSHLGSPTGQPLVAVSETGNLRRSVLTGYGWYRISQSISDDDRLFVRTLMDNLVSWTASRPDNRLLTVDPASQSFGGGEPVVLNAYLRNESGDTESEASIQVTLEGDAIDERFYSMQNTGPGQYALSVPALPEGLYRFEAEATRGDRTIDTRSGEFGVSGSNAELVDTRRNDQLLRRMAVESGGAFRAWDSLDGFWNSLEQRGLLDAETRVQETLFYPYRWWPWFALVIVLLAGEWLLRKYYALP